MRPRAAALDGWRRFWTGAGGAGEVLGIAYPLILSSMSFTIQTFVDRIFLTWYSPEALAGSVTGLFTTYALIGTFIGTGEYLTTFVAQYHGAGRPERIGPAVWQGIYFSFLAGLLMAALIPLLRPLFALAGHAPLVQSYEVAFARILLMGAFPIVLMATLATFFSGRGQTLVVLWVNVLSTIVNVVLDYLWIFGHGGFPRAGVAGAAWATVVSQVLGALVFFVLMMRPESAKFHTRTGWRLELPLLGRLLRYGLPAGLQFSLEIAAFALFMMIMGRIGTEPLAATGIAFSLNAIVFLPMMGLAIGVSSLVGRYLGVDRPELAERSTWSAFWLSLIYMAACGVFYVFFPRLLLAPYAAGSDPALFAGVGATATVLLRFVALYSIFDMMNVVFAAGLKGAGDTLFPLAASVALSWATMLAPAYVLCVLGSAGVYTAWTAASVYVMLVGLLMLHRFRAGRWKSLRVIEPSLPELERVPAEGEPA